MDDMTPYNALWSAVIIQALQDLCVWRESGWRRGEKASDAVDAMKFIFGENIYGVCAILEISPENVRIAARKILAGRLKRELRKCHREGRALDDFFS